MARPQGTFGSERPPAVRTARERAAMGRAVRVRVPRSAHAGFTPAADRPDPVTLLQDQATDRVADLLPIRYGRMAVSEFTFFRGAAAVMAADLATTPDSGLVVQACGDAHLSNFGFFASPERQLVFDINDFDETLPGPWEWDVKRLAASVEVAGRDRGLDDADRRAAVRAACSSYREAMRGFAGATNLEVWYAHANVDALRRQYLGHLKASRRKMLDRSLDKARTRDNTGALARFTAMVDGQPRFTADPPLVVPVRDLLTEVPDIEASLYALLRQYRDTLPVERRVLFDQYRAVDLARKVVGVGSVGTRCWMVLLLGRDPQDPLFLQAKEAGTSVLETHLGRAAEKNHGQRVVIGQRLMQAVGDIFLGWLRVSGIEGADRDFYLRQLRDWKGSLEVEEMLPRGLRLYAELCGWTLARAHARTGDRIAIAAYLGSGRSFDDALVHFAEAYADQNARDHRALVTAITEGRVEATAGV
jgi:uncharacterized protein (DUF2252 family)